MWIVKYTDAGALLTEELFEEEPTKKTLENRWTLMWGENRLLSYELNGGPQRVYDGFNRRMVACDEIRLSTPTRTSPYLLELRSRFERLGMRMPGWAKRLRSNAGSR